MMSPPLMPAEAAAPPEVTVFTSAPATVLLEELLESPTVAPSRPWVAFLFWISSSAIRLAMFDGMANPTPMLPDWPLDEEPEPVDAIATFTPMTRPWPSSSAPPELPGLIAASVWMTAREIVWVPVVGWACDWPCDPPPSPKFQKLNGLSPPPLPSPELPLGLLGTAEDWMLMLRFRALTMPVVTVPGRSSGAPIAIVVSPTFSRLESAKVAGVRPLAPVSLMTARSFTGSVPTIVAL